MQGNSKRITFQNKNIQLTFEEELFSHNKKTTDTRFVALSTFIHVLLGWSILLSTIISALIIIIYTSVSGLKGDLLMFRGFSLSFSIFNMSLL